MPPTGFREPGFSKECRLGPQITIGLLTDVGGFPLMVSAFEGKQAETKTIRGQVVLSMVAIHLGISGCSSSRWAAELAHRDQDMADSQLTPCGHFAVHMCQLFFMFFGPVK
jgi:hypothetical protein